MNSRVDLTKLILETAVLTEIRIHSLENWKKIDQIGEGENAKIYKWQTPHTDWPVVAGKRLRIPKMFNLSTTEKENLQKVRG